MKSIALIHTVQSVALNFGNELRNNLDEEVELHNIWDDFLATNPNKIGEFTNNNRNRLFRDIKNAEDTGADIIVVTCSTLTPIVKLIRPFIKTPVIAIDDALAKEAVFKYNKIFVLATAKSAINPTKEKLIEEATLLNKTIQIETKAVTDAFKALQLSNMKEHDEVLLDAVKDIKNCECVVLAQASMAHLADKISDCLNIPVLASPKLCMNQVNELLKTINVTKCV
ncbi:MAG: aspartate/glutamate racemase family protein [Suipraeoptans sp.]